MGAESMRALCERSGRGPQSPSEEPSSVLPSRVEAICAGGGGCEPGCSS